MLCCWLCGFQHNKFFMLAEELSKTAMLIFSRAKYKGRETKISWASSLFLVVADILGAVWLTALILNEVELFWLQLHYSSFVCF